MRPQPLVTVLLAATLLAVPLDAQGMGATGLQSADPSLHLDPASAPQGTSGLVVGKHLDDLVAMAPDWAAVFSAAGVRFLTGPPEGTDTDTQEGIQFQLTGVHRDEGYDVSLGVPPQLQHPYEVRFDRDVLIELWQARLAGLKHSFVFPEPLPGKGPLVVGMKLHTSLVASEVSPTGITFSDGRKNVLSIGSVVGIDANGWTVSGKLSLKGDSLDFVLPAQFVDNAAYPIELDPLVTPVRRVPATSYADREVDVAWDADNLRYCLVWERHYSSGTIANLAQVFESDGTPVLPLAFLGWSFGDSAEPAVCSVNSEDVFVTAHAYRSSSTERIVLTGIRATDLRMTRRYETLPGFIAFDVGGDPHESQSDVCLVWSHATGVDGRHFVAQAESIVPNDPAFAIESGAPFGFRDPRISQSCGTTGLWGVAWENRTESGEPLVQVSTVERGGLGGPVYSLDTGLREPSIDGDGELFFVASVGDTGHRIYGYRMEFAPGGILSTLLLTHLKDSPSASLYEPEVALTTAVSGPAFSVGWRRSELNGWATIEVATISEDLLDFIPPYVVTGLAGSMRMASLRTANFDAPPTGLFTIAVGRRFGVDHVVAIP